MPRVLKKKRPGVAAAERHALRRLTNANKAVERTEALLRLVNRRQKIARSHYAATRPLTAAEREELARHVDAGGALCCHEGLKWLRERLPEPWAIALNEWAYWALSCKSSRWRAEEIEKVLGLILDRFPE